MNYERIYEYRFSGIKQSNKNAAWKIIADFIFKKLNYPKTILDPAAGFCEFINNVPAKEKWIVDLNEEFIKKHCNLEIKKIIGNNLEVVLPSSYFDGIFVSNFLEHLNSKEEIAVFLTRMNDALKPGGIIAIMGPNFKYCFRNYFDFADHNLILTETSLEEHLYAANFFIKETYPQFLPLTFKSKLPPIPFLIKLYLKVPLFWKIFGKQFLLIAKKQ